MNKRSVRRYRSPLREGQAETTARRIAEAATRVLERGLAGLSVPAVAREAGVSVPTVYHHFADKAALIRAVSDHVDRLAGIDALPAPGSPAELAQHIRHVFPHLDARQALMGPALRGPEGEALRREWLAERAAMVRGALSAAASRCEPAEFERLVSIVTLLCTSQTLGVLHEYLGLSAEEAAATVAWAIFKLSEESKP
jgi:AcrR family transcriptional regulator